MRFAFPLLAGTVLLQSGCTPTSGHWEVYCGNAPAFDLVLERQKAERDVPIGYALIPTDQGGLAEIDVFGDYPRNDARDGDRLEVEIPDLGIDLDGEVSNGSWQGECKEPGALFAGLLGVVVGVACGGYCDISGFFWDSDLEGPLLAHRLGDVGHL